MLNIISHQRNASENDNKITFYTEMERKHSIGEDMGKREPPRSADGVENGAVLLETSLVVRHNIKHMTQRFSS